MVKTAKFGQKKRVQISLNPLKMAGQEGLEPPTQWLTAISSHVKSIGNIDCFCSQTLKTTTKLLQFIKFRTALHIHSNSEFYQFLGYEPAYIGNFGQIGRYNQQLKQ
jgi:hypothetical protein